MLQVLSIALVAFLFTPCLAAPTPPFAPALEKRRRAANLGDAAAGSATSDKAWQDESGLEHTAIESKLTHRGKSSR